MQPDLREDMNHHKRAFVLLSGGIDSSTTLALAVSNMQDLLKSRMIGSAVEAYSMDYGQRHVKEAEAARKICEHYGVSHKIIDIRGALGKNSMLTDASQEVPNISYAEIDGVSPTYVPFRNGFMLSRLAAHAQEHVDSIRKSPQYQSLRHALFEDLVTLYFGAHAEDAQNWAYPDCTPEFVGAMANAIYIGTYRCVRLLTPFNYSTKDQIIKQGFNLGVPYHYTWSCYKGEALHCGVCPTCRARKQAFQLADVPDPTEYAA